MGGERQSRKGSAPGPEFWALGSGFQALGSRPLGGTEGFYELLALVRKSKEAEWQKVEGLMWKPQAVASSRPCLGDTGLWRRT